MSNKQGGRHIKTFPSWLLSGCASGHSPASDCFLLTHDLDPQVSAPPLTWMCITHASSQGHPRLNLDTVSYNMLGVDGDGEEEARGPWGWDGDSC